MTTQPVDVLAVLDACGAYVDDAAAFPEQFKPGLVKRHQREYTAARNLVAGLIEATRLQPIETAPLDGTIIVAHFDHHPPRPAMFDGETWVVWGAMTEGAPAPIGWHALARCGAPT